MKCLKTTEKLNKLEADHRSNVYEILITHDRGRSLGKLNNSIATDAICVLTNQYFKDRKLIIQGLHNERCLNCGEDEWDCPVWCGVSSKTMHELLEEERESLEILSQQLKESAKGLIHYAIRKTEDGDVARHALSKTKYREILNEL